MSNQTSNFARSSRTMRLLKQRSWSPDIERDEAWTRRKTLYRNQKGQLSRTVTDVDLDELKGCIDLGFGFGFGFEIDSPAARRLSGTFPALDLYFGVHRNYGDSNRSSSCGSSSDESSLDSSPMCSALSIVSPGDSPELVKARLKQWAQAVGCSMRQHY